MTLEQAYKMIKKMDEVLDFDILNDEEYTSAAKRRFKLMEQIGLEEQRQKQLAIKTISPDAWQRGFLDSFVVQGHRCHHISYLQRNVLYGIGGFEPFRYNGYVFRFIKDALLVEKIAEKSFLENF